MCLNKDFDNYCNKILAYKQSKYNINNTINNITINDTIKD
jgi:hypothetical protein